MQGCWHKSYLLFLLLQILVTFDRLQQLLTVRANRTHCTDLNAGDSLGANAVPLHRRQRRYLFFEKGAAFTFQGNMAKAIISGVPRGLNIIMEYTLMYELPTSVDAYRSPAAVQHKRITTSTGRPEQSGGSCMHPYNWWRDEQLRRWCVATLPAPRRSRRRRRAREDVQSGGNWPRFQHVSERILFDLIKQLAQWHNYNERYCVLRTLCELRYLLWPPGHSLLHDIVRILFNYALPAIQRHATFTTAALRPHANLAACASLYGPHCRLSFLEHFTAIVHHGVKFM